MKRVVVDASVGIKWFIPEVHEHDALKLIERNVELLAPDLIYAEIGNILWKKWRQGEIDAEDVLGLIHDFKAVNLNIHETGMLMEKAWEIAKRHNRSFYDSTYIALAVESECQVATADIKLYNSLKNSQLRRHILWIEDIP